MSALLAAVAGLAAGIGIESAFGFGWTACAFALILSLLCAGAAFLAPRRASAHAAGLFFFAALGMIRAELAAAPLPDAFAGSLGQRVSYEGVVAADPDLRDASQRIEVAVSRGGASTNMLVVAARYPHAAVGDRVRVAGELSVPETFADDNGRIFRYDKYLERDGIRFVLSYASLRVVASAPWYSIPAALARAKHVFLDGLARALPEPYASLAGGIVIGGKSGLGTELQNAFAKSGLVQIIVLSGYNVMIVAEWVMAGIARMRLRRAWAAGAGAAAVALFVGIAGASATALRAALMAFIALYARATGRSYAAGRALLAAVFLMLAYNPLYLAFDPGFGLSVAATAGLIWLAPGIEARMGAVRLPAWRAALATTIAAQIAVLPLLLYDTGNLSFVALPANLLAMPLVPSAMAFSALAGIAGICCGAIAPAAAVAFGLPAYLLTRLLVALARGSAALPFSALTVPAFSFWFVLAGYAALAFIAASKRFSATAQLRLEKNASR